MPILSWNGCRYNFTCSPSEKSLPKEAGFHWSHREKVWWSGLSSSARALAQYADSRAKERLDRESQQIAQSKALNPEEISAEGLYIPVPSGLAYLPFQKAGILAALARMGFNISQLKEGGSIVPSVTSGDVLLADGMGL